ncbi:MAG TPA: PAS domain S-box protein [Candidatus Eisenbacteria bacterium]|nr:PAS domain S-box protein [Candidatus Eisenbacteria bacterium]
MSVQPETPAEEIKRLRRCINDLVSVLALPATWTGGEPSRIIGNLLDALLRMLGLDFVYVRLGDATGTAPAEMVRISPAWAFQPEPHEVGEKLRSLLDGGFQEAPLPLSDFLGNGEIALAPLQLGLHGEMGIIIAGSRRLNFPQQTEKLVLNVAANEAAIWLRGASLLSEQRRVSSELDRRVAQRTADLAASNDELRKETAERKSAEARLRQEKTELKRSQAHKAAILDSSLDCIVAIDHQGCITEFNPAAERVLGYRREDVLGKHLVEVIIPPSLRQKHLSGFARHLATGESRVLGQRLEMTALCADGREIPVEIAIARIEQDGPPSFTGYLRDITLRKENEAALFQTHAKLAHSEERWRSVFESSAIGVALTDLNGQFIATNPVYQKMLGYTEHEFEELRFLDLAVDEDQSMNNVLIAELLSGKRRQFQIEKQYRRKNGSLVWVRNSVSLVPGSERVPRFLMVLSEDVTRRHTVEAALDKARSDLAHVARISMLSALTASIAHEVNQPLSGIVTNASTCLRMLDANPPNLEGARETARRTIRDGNRASEVITRLRALFTKKSAISAESFDLNEAAKEVIALSVSELHRNRVILQSELAANLPSISGDRIQIQQVILNLIRNGSDAMNTVEDRPRELLITTARDESGGVRLSVRDSGVGLEPQIEEKLFEPFYTTKSDGMGIGLSVSMSIIENHQGRLWAIPNEGPGATFVFSIPCSTNT